MEIDELFRRQRELQAEATTVRSDLGLDELLSPHGEVVSVAGPGTPTRAIPTGCTWACSAEAPPAGSGRSRQPDLAHVRDLPPRLTEQTRAAILSVKSAWVGRPEYGRQVRSWDIYTAVLDHGVRTPSEFDDWLRRTRQTA